MSEYKDSQLRSWELSSQWYTEFREPPKPQYQIAQS